MIILNILYLGCFFVYAATLLKSIWMKAMRCPKFKKNDGRMYRGANERQRVKKVVGDF